MFLNSYELPKFLKLQDFGASRCNQSRFLHLSMPQSIIYWNSLLKNTHKNTHKVYLSPILSSYPAIMSWLEIYDSVKTSWLLYLGSEWMGKGHRVGSGKGYVFWEAECNFWGSGEVPIPSASHFQNSGSWILSNIIFLNSFENWNVESLVTAHSHGVSNWKYSNPSPSDYAFHRRDLGSVNLSNSTNTYDPGTDDYWMLKSNYFSQQALV